MKKASLLVLGIALLLAAAPAGAQYVGTMAIGSYADHNVEATLRVSGQQATLTLHRVKFARMMPVRVDMQLSGLRVQGDSVLAARVVPMSKGKPYEKYLVTVLRGRCSAGHLTLRATMGGKPWSYDGRAGRSQ